MEATLLQRNLGLSLLICNRINSLSLFLPTSEGWAKMYPQMSRKRMHLSNTSLTLILCQALF